MPLSIMFLKNKNKAELQLYDFAFISSFDTWKR